MSKATHQSRHFLRIGKTIGCIKPIFSITNTACTTNSSNTDSSEVTSKQVHENLQHFFTLPSEKVVAFRDTKSSTGNTYVMSTGRNAIRPANNDYLALISASRLVIILESKLPHGSGTLISAMANNFTFVDQNKNAQSVPYCDMIKSGDAKLNLDVLSQTLRSIKEELSGGCRRYDSSSAKRLRDWVASITDNISLNEDLGLPAYPVEVITFIDAMRFLSCLMSLTPSSLRTFIVNCETVEIPDQKPDNNEAFHTLVKEIATTQQAMLTVDKQMKLSDILKYDKDSNRFMQELVGDFSINILEARWAAYSEILIACDKLSRHLDSRWGLLERYIDLLILKSCRSGEALPKEVSSIIGFWKEDYTAPGVTKNWRLSCNRMNASEIDECLSLTKQLVEDVLSYCVLTLDLCYSECTVPYKGFRVHRDHYKTTGREYIYRIEKSPDPILTSKTAFGVRWVRSEVLAINGVTGKMMQNGATIQSVAIEPKTVTLTPKGVVRGDGTHPVEATATDDVTEVYIGGKEIWLSDLREETKAHCSFLEFNFDEITKMCTVEVRCEAFCILPPSTGKDVVAFGQTSRLQAPGELFSVSSIDIEKSSVAQLLLAFPAIEVVEAPSPVLEKLYLSRIDNLSQPGVPRDCELYPALIERQEVDPLVAALGYGQLDTAINVPADMEVSSDEFKDQSGKSIRTYYVSPGFQPKAQVCGLPLVVAIPNGFTSRQYWIPYHDLSQRAVRDLQDSSFNGIVQYGALRPVQGETTHPVVLRLPESIQDLDPKVKEWAKTNNMVQLTLTAHNTDSFEFTSHVLRPSRHGGGKSTNLAYQPGFATILEQFGNVVLSDYDGWKGITHRYFRRYRESISDYSLDRTPAAVCAEYARNICLSCYEKLRQDTDAVDYVDLNVAKSELGDFVKILKSSDFSRSCYVDVTFGMSGASCKIADLIDALETFIKSPNVEKITALMSCWGSVYVEKAHILGLAVGIVVDNRSLGLMKDFWSGSFTYFDSPKLITNLRGSAEVSLSETIADAGVLSFINNSFVKYVEHQMTADVTWVPSKKQSKSTNA